VRCDYHHQSAAVIVGAAPTPTDDADAATETLCGMTGLAAADAVPATTPNPTARARIATRRLT